MTPEAGALRPCAASWLWHQRGSGRAASQKKPAPSARAASLDAGTRNGPCFGPPCRECPAPAKRTKGAPDWPAVVHPEASLPSSPSREAPARGRTRESLPFVVTCHRVASDLWHPCKGTISKIVPNRPARLLKTQASGFPLGSHSIRRPNLPLLLLPPSFPSVTVYFFSLRMALYFPCRVSVCWARVATTALSQKRDV